jgi:hypothetical protein
VPLIVVLSVELAKTIRLCIEIMVHCIPYLRMLHLKAFAPCMWDIGFQKGQIKCLCTRARDEANDSEAGNSV